MRTIRTRLISISLALVLVLGMLPVTALAAASTGGGSGSSITTGDGNASGTGSYATLNIYGSFTRLTLVEFDVQDWTNDATTPYQLTADEWLAAYSGDRAWSIDIPGYNADATELYYYDSNVMDYRKAGYDADVTLKKGWYADSDPSDHHVTLVNNVPGELKSIFGGVHWWKGVSTNPVNQLMYAGAPLSDDGRFSYGTPSMALDELMTKFNDVFGTGIYTDSFLTQTDGKSYRIFVEPGILFTCRNTTGHTWNGTLNGKGFAFTLRDIFEFADNTTDNEGNCNGLSGDHLFSSAFWTPIGHLAYSLYNLDTELQTYKDGVYTLVNGTHGTETSGTLTGDQIAGVKFTNAKHGIRIKKEVQNVNGARAYPEGTDFYFTVWGTWNEDDNSDNGLEGIDFPVYFRKYDYFGNLVEDKWDDLLKDNASSHTFILRDGDTLEMYGFPYPHEQEG